VRTEVRGTSHVLVRNAAQIVTLDGGAGALGVIDRGAMSVREGRIVWAGPERDLPPAEAPARETRVLDAQGCAIVPGLVDCHTHTVFAGDRCDDFELRVSGLGYAELARRGGGIATTVRATRAADEDTLRAAAEARLSRMLAYGVTCVEIKSGYGLDVENELKMLRVIRSLGERVGARIVPTFLGAHAVPPELRSDTNGRARYVDLVVEEMIPRVAEEGLARFCDVYLEAGVAFDAADARRILEAARARGLGLKVHADQLADGGGAALAAELGAISADHLEHTSALGARALARAQVVGVLLPGASSFLGGAHHAPARRLADAGVELALATDCNPGTAPTEALPLCASIACTQMGLSPGEALRAMTLGGAAALGLQAEIGSLAPGKEADFVVLDAPDWRHLVWRFGAPIARAVVVHGEVVFEARPS
jgi:imidazolonepropionase